MDIYGLVILKNPGVGPLSFNLVDGESTISISLASGDFFGPVRYGVLTDGAKALIDGGSLQMLALPTAAYFPSVNNQLGPGFVKCTGIPGVYNTQTKINVLEIEGWLGNNASVTFGETGLQLAASSYAHEARAVIGVDAAGQPRPPTAHSHSFSSDISETPNTLAGYGILDAVQSNPDFIAIAGLDTNVGYVRRNSVGNWTAVTSVPISDVSGIGTVGLSLVGSDTQQEARTTLGIWESDAPSLSGLRLLPYVPASHQQGLLYWDEDDHTVNLMSDIPGTSNALGYETWARIVNKTGSTLDDGSVVYISGAQGNRPTATKAVASDSGADKTLGVITNTVADNSEGVLTAFGVVKGIDTSGFTAGDTLWLSHTTPGAYTNVRPPKPYHAVRVGTALNSTNNGSIFVSVDPGADLAGLHDVDISSLSQYDILRWDGSVWSNHSLNFSDLSGQFIEIGVGNSTNPTFIDWHSADSVYPDYSSRVIRDGLENGSFHILNRGTGEISLHALDSGTIGFWINGVRRGGFSSNGEFSSLDYRNFGKILKHVDNEYFGVTGSSVYDSTVARFEILGKSFASIPNHATLYSSRFRALSVDGSTSWLDASDVGVSIWGDPGGSETLRVLGSVRVSDYLVAGTLAAYGASAPWVQGAYLQWNRENGVGYTSLVNQRGLGGGGIEFAEYYSGAYHRILFAHETLLEVPHGIRAINNQFDLNTQAVDLLAGKYFMRVGGEGGHHLAFDYYSIQAKDTATSTRDLVLQAFGSSVVIGSDPGGAEKLRVTGGARISGTTVVQGSGDTRIVLFGNSAVFETNNNVNGGSSYFFTDSLGWANLYPGSAFGLRMNPDGNCYLGGTNTSNALRVSPSGELYTAQKLHGPVAAPGTGATLADVITFLQSTFF